MARPALEDARRSRTRQGLPERIEDLAAVAVLATLLRAVPVRPGHRATVTILFLHLHGAVIQTN